jgi:ectoine hydroxylase-related dioxygenase (phytanoyl-CoA dioxygenase family)
MLAPHAHSIDLDSVIAHFREHGWARVGHVASDAFIAAIRARCDDIMLGRVIDPRLFFQHDSHSGRYEDLVFGRGWEGPSLEYRKIEKLEVDPLFRAWLANGLFERIARRLVGLDVSIYRATLFTKGARGGTDLPWHQDGGSFWGLDRDPELQIWTALDDAPIEAGCVEVLDASHSGGLARPFGGMIPAEIRERVRPDERKVSLPARAGEVLLIHNYLWHRSGRNLSGRTRRAFTATYMPAATRCLRKRTAPRTFVRVFEGVPLR